MKPLIFALALALLAPAAVAGTAWKPTSTTSVSITGPIVLSDDALTASGAVFPLRLVARARAFKSDQGARPARIFAVTAPVNPPLLNGNRLCGDEPARWIVALPMADGALALDAFTTAARPTGEDSPGLCGTFFYNR